MPADGRAVCRYAEQVQPAIAGPLADGGLPGEDAVHGMPQRVLKD